MKIYFSKPIIFAAVISTSLLSCEKLDESVYSSVFTSNFYQSSKDAEAALTASYGSLGLLYYGPAAILCSDFSADQTYPRPVVGRNTLTLFSYDVDYTTQKSFNRASQEGPLGIWQYSYKGIENSNWVIEKVPAIDMDPVRRDAIVGEALFLRAFYHFMLTKNFKDVIVKVSPTKTESDAFIANSAQADVYKQIYKDLDDAISKLPPYGASTVKGRVTKEVAIALYAKAALYAGDWAIAKDKSREVINAGKFNLVANVLDLYHVDKEDNARTEILFAFEGERIEANNPNNYSWLMGLCGPLNSQGRDYGNTTFGSMFAYQSFFDSFDPADKRRQLLDTTYINRSNVVIAQKNITPITTRGVLVKKYMDKNSSGPKANCNVPILRLADMYLIAAEAEANLNGATAEAYQYINAVRVRAGLTDLISGLSKDDFIKAVLRERGWEFFAEGDRWYDLTRTNTFLSAIPAAVNNVYPVRTPEARHRYFPIPQDEIRTNSKVKQNAEWN